MRRLLLVLLPVALTIVVACSDDGSATTAASVVEASGSTSTTTTVGVVEVSGSTGTAVESGEFEVFDNGTSSDNRLVGTYKLRIECDISEDGEATIADCTGPNTMTNDDGNWDGTCEGTSTWSTTEPEHLHVFDCTYIGGGDYAGLRFIQHLEGTDYPWAYTGTIEPVG